MFRFIQRIFIPAMSFVGCGALISSNPWKWVSVNNQEDNVRSATVNINNDEPFFYPYSILVNNPCAKLCVPDVWLLKCLICSKCRCECKETMGLFGSFYVWMWM